MAEPTVMSNLNYGWETTFGTVSPSVDKAFGLGVKTTNLNRRNNMERVYGQGARNAQKIVAKLYEATISVEHKLANPWFIRGVLGKTSSDGGASPFTHTYAEADTLPGVSVINNIDMDTDSQATLLGCKMDVCTIASAINEVVNVRLDMPYVNEAEDSSTTAIIAETFDLYTFANGTLELPDTATLAMVQNFEATVNNNAEVVYGQGSRLGQKMPVKNREYGGSITMALQAASDLLEKCYGSVTGPSTTTVAEQADMVMTFTNGLTGTNQRDITFTWTGVQIDEDSLPQDPAAVIMEDVTWMARSLAVVASDNTETAL